MRLEIKSWINGCVLWDGDIPDDTPVEFRLRVASALAVASGADLHGANLARANLAGAHLADANLADAYLADAYLADADLARANLARAIFDIPTATPEQAIANLDKVREIILDDSKRLEMGHWHEDGSWAGRTCAEEAVCGTSHCLAGWLQVCATDERVRKLAPNIAGTICAPVAAKMFYADNKTTLEWLRDRKYAAEA